MSTSGSTLDQRLLMGDSFIKYSHLLSTFRIKYLLLILIQVQWNLNFTLTHRAGLVTLIER